MKYSKYKFKTILRKIHLYLGFISGIVVFIVSITGCLYAFQFEIRDLTEPYRFVESVNNKAISIGEIKDIAEKSMGGEKARRIYRLPGNRSTMVLFYGKGYYNTIFVDQFSGKILKNKDMYYDFFTIVLELHRHLLIPGEIGELIVAISTLIFVLLMISGIILWWPKKNPKEKLKIKWNAKWQRKNYDLHTVMGFYSTWILIFIALTGLVWGFKWFEKSVYWVASGGEPLPQRPGFKSDTTNIAINQRPLDIIYNQLRSKYPEETVYIMLLPKEKDDLIKVLTNSGLDHFRNMAYHYYDQYSLREFKASPRYAAYEDAGFADKILKLNYDIHTGSIFGIVGKIIVFFASLISASLPVTGFIMWKGRRYKKVRESKVNLVEKTMIDDGSLV